MKISSAALVLWMLANSFYPGGSTDKTKYICFEIISEPVGAMVTKSHPNDQLDTYIGMTPVDLRCFSTEHIAEGSSTIHVKKPGYQEWKLEIDLHGYYDSLPTAQKKPVLIQAVLRKTY